MHLLLVNRHLLLIHLLTVYRILKIIKCLRHKIKNTILKKILNRDLEIILKKEEIYEVNLL